MFKQHLSSLERMWSDTDSGGCLPKFVTEEPQNFLECGILGYGFAQMHCENCRKRAFNLHAVRRVAPNDRQGGEMLCRYILRPPGAKGPWANERLHLPEDGGVTWLRNCLPL